MTLLPQQPAPQFTAPAVMPDDTIQEDFSLRDFGWEVPHPLLLPVRFFFRVPNGASGSERKRGRLSGARM